MSRSDRLRVAAAAVATDATDIGCSLPSGLEMSFFSRANGVLDRALWTWEIILKYYSVTRGSKRELAIVGCHGIADFSSAGSNMDAFLQQPFLGPRRLCPP